MAKDPETILIALISGIVPALIWLWFWLREDRENPEPKGLILFTFICGMLAVILVLPIEKLAKTYIENENILTLTLATMEELVKYLAAGAIAIKSSRTDEPMDYAIHMVTAALGFAALENGLFLMDSISLNQTAVSILTGNLRFLGATLLHATASSFVGIAIGLAFMKSRATKNYYLLAGFVAAISLHSIFNFYIIRSKEGNYLQVFGFLWVTTILSLLLFEKLRRISFRLKEQSSLTETSN